MSGCSSRRVKMVVGGALNLVLLVAFALLVVVLSENQVVHRVLATTVTEAHSNKVVLATGDAGSFVGKEEPVAQDDPNEIQKTIFAFRGIPYASPPIGELRWEPPQPVELKATPHQAGEFKPACSQWSVTKGKVVGAPDCLYLNVFTPYIPVSSKRRISGNVTSWTVENPNLLPVLVYIHGGEFISGSATRYSPDALMKRERVILVTFNYRLGVLGFLSSGNEELPGNYGLMDQIAAMKWISKYIHRFGGNPLRVTVFGSVEYLLLAKYEEELFHAAILKPQSTSVLSPFAKVESGQGGRNFMKELGANVGCRDESGEDVRSLIDCLKKADTDSLIRSQLKILSFHNFPFPHLKARLGPVADGVLLEDEPEVLFTSGKFREIPLMVGLSTNEGYNPFLEFYLKLARKIGPERKSTLENVFDEEEVRSGLQSVFKTVMAGIPDIEENGAFERVFQSIWNYYFGGIPSKSWQTEIDQVVQKLFRLFGDMLVNTGHCKLLHALSANAKSPVFSYAVTHGMSNFPDFFQTSREILEGSEKLLGPKRPKRSPHLSLDTPWEEQFYLLHPLLEEQDNFTQKLYPGPGEDGGLSDEDKRISDTLAKIWVSFAKYAQPKQAMGELPDYGRWMKIEPGHRSLNYLLISDTALQRGMRSDFRKAECQFWMSTVPQVRQLSKTIQELEPFPILFWSSIAVVVLFALIILTLIVLIIWAKHRQGSYGRGDGIYLHHARPL